MASVRSDLFEKIAKVYPALSPKKRRVADLIIKDYKMVFLMTAREIARECQVSEPTIIRFANDLGFSGYAEFVHYMKGLLHIELTSVERLQRTRGQTGEATTLSRYCQNAVHNMENLMNSVTGAELGEVARIIHAAKVVYVVGYRASAPLAYYFGYLLKKIRDNVVVDISLNWELKDSMAHSGKDSVLLAIAFPRYPRRTIELINYAKRYKLKVIGLSDTLQSPVVAFADRYVIIDFDSVSFIEPFAHMVAYLGALLHEVTFLDKEKAMRFLSKFDESVQVAEEFFTLEGSRGNEPKRIPESSHDPGAPTQEAAPV